MAQNSHYRPGFSVQPQQPYDPRQYPQYQQQQQPRQPVYHQQYQQQPGQPQYYPQQHQPQVHQPPPPQQYQYPYPQTQQHPQYAQPQPPRPRSSLGHAHSHSVPVAPGHHHFPNPPPLSPSALQAQAAQARAQALGRPLPPPRRAETLPPADQRPIVAQYPQQQQFHPAYAIPVPPQRSPSTSTPSRPLPTPTSSNGTSRSPAKHQSIDLGRLPPAQPPAAQLVRAPVHEPPPQQETQSQIRRRASPPRFTGGSGSWSEPPSRPEPTKPIPSSANASPSEFKDLLSGAGSPLTGGKFIPLWKRGLANASGNASASNGRPLPSAPATATTAAPAQSGGLKRGGSLHVRSPATASPSKSSPSPEPTESESESEVEEQGGPESESEESESESEISGSEDVSSDAGSSNAQPSFASPQYGIRDLPQPPSLDGRASTLPRPPEIRGSNFEARSAPGVIEGGGSRTLMFAAAGLNGTPLKNNWPVGVPPLPRTPGSREVVNLEDSPPVSTIKRATGQSTYSFNAPPSSPLSKLPSLGRDGPPPPAPSSSQLPSFSFSGPPSPPPPVKAPSLSFSGPPTTPQQIPSISLPDDSPPSAHVSVPQINLPGDDDNIGGPTINVQDVDSKPKAPPQIFEVPGISFAGGQPSQTSRSLPARPTSTSQRRGLACGGCSGSITGRIVNAMGFRWHPECFRCTVCSELLEHVSSYEKDGKAYCHLDYHENFAPRCYSCKTAIVEESFISLDDPQLGKRTYHEQHFFCAECGDPFLPPALPASKGGELAFSGDGAFVSDDVGFTVYRGHPYCEACHVRLRLPKCKKCKRSIRDGDEAVEALGGKWCWKCFCCAGCEKPFEDPSFFERDSQPWCEPCYSILLRNEI
ncbi:hypothetical protein B0H15DRAFT_809372 [Mycena belliarum]|uniref:LIM zinc-binding domain-containing protein n=1 Tax=Mycena belliarum TaxID=1033014 RepID=A0AAD6XWP9_9AGAR|nr:hypothetical protein B0H15DRAFT_809372 [Mycena belliae]